MRCDKTLTQLVWLCAAMSSLPSTDSLYSLVLNDTSQSPSKPAVHSPSVIHPSLEKELAAAAEAIMTEQVNHHAS